MKKLGILMTFLMLAFMTQAATVTLTGIDALGTSSFNTAGLWDNAAAPSAGNDYFVPDLTRLRTPADGGVYTFLGDSLTINNTTPYGDGFMYKGTSNTGSLTIANFILDGGLVSHANGTGDICNLYGGMTIAAGGGRLYAKQGPINVYSDVVGSGTITVPATDAGSGSPRELTFYSSTSTFTGDIVVEGRFILAAGTAPDPNAVLNFVIGANGVNNSVSGAAAAVIFNGNFNIDLTSAGTTPGDSWAIVTASNVTYGATFAPNGFTDLGSDKWQKDANGTTYLFDESTGVLSVYVPELDEDIIDHILYDEEYPVLNGDLTLPGGSNVNPGWDGDLDGLGQPDIPGWTGTEYGATTDGGTGGGGTGPSADGDGWHAAVQSIDPNVYNIADVNMVEGITYTYTGQFAPRWGLIGGEMSIIADDDPNILLVTAPISFPVDHSDNFYPATVSYTATASDEIAEKKIGIYIDALGDTGWLRFDDIHLYSGYLAVHGVTDQAPDGVDVEPVDPLVLSWTPSNDPNLEGTGTDEQILYYYIGNGDGSNPDYASYVAASGNTLAYTANSFDTTVSIAADQYCLWRVDTVIDGVEYTGKTILFATRTADEVPAIQEWQWYRTWVGEPTTLWADVNDFGEGDITLLPDDGSSIVWEVTVGDPNLVITGTDPGAPPHLHPEATVVGDAPGDYEVTLVVTDNNTTLPPQPSNTATYQVHVYADACAAAIASGVSYNVYDSDTDCDVDIVDLAAFATQWLDDRKLTVPFDY